MFLGSEVVDTDSYCIDRTAALQQTAQQSTPELRVKPRIFHHAHAGSKCGGVSVFESLINW